MVMVLPLSDTSAVPGGLGRLLLSSLFWAGLSVTKTNNRETASVSFFGVIGRESPQLKLTIISRERITYKNATGQAAVLTFF